MIDLLYFIGLLIWLALASCPIALTSCCCGCTIFSDQFIADNLATDYTTVSGSWSVGAGKLSAGSTNSILLVNATSPSNRHIHTVTPTLGAVGDVATVIAGYQDANNYLFLELTRGISNTTAKFYKVVAGVQTQVGSDRTIGVSAPTVTFCCGDTKTLIVLSWPCGFGTCTCRLASTTVLSTGNQVGVGTGGTAAAVSFDNLTLAKHFVDDPTCSQCAANCSTCGVDTDYDNARWRITITGWVRGSCSSTTDCLAHNGQWYTDACSGPCATARRTDPVTNFCGGFFTDFQNAFEFPAATNYDSPVPAIPSTCTVRVATFIQATIIPNLPNIVYQKDLAGLGLAGVQTLPVVFGPTTGACDGTAALCTAELIP